MTITPAEAPLDRFHTIDNTCVLPAVKNRTLPYQHLDNYVQRRAQMQIVSRLYQLPSLAKPKVNYTRVGEENITSHEKVYPDFPTIVLTRPMRKIVGFGGDDGLQGQMVKYFATVYAARYAGSILERIDTSSMVRHGGLRLAGDGDRARTAIQIKNDRNEHARDNSYVKYDLLPDQNARFRYRPDEPIRRTHYGRLHDIYYVEFVEEQGKEAAENQPAIARKVKPYLLARVTECNTNGLDAADPRVRSLEYEGEKTPDIIHAGTISAVIGRINVGGNRWAIIDRSSSGARTQFVDDEGNAEY